MKRLEEASATRSMPVGILDWHGAYKRTLLEKKKRKEKKKKKKKKKETYTSRNMAGIEIRSE